MDIKAERDKSSLSLTRHGSFKISTTSGTIPFKIRRLAFDDSCEAKYLDYNDEIHINESFQKVFPKNVKVLMNNNKKSMDLKESLIDRYSYNFPHEQQHVNILRLGLIDAGKINNTLLDNVCDIISATKNNHLIVPPWCKKIISLDEIKYFLNAIEDRGIVEPRGEIIGYIPLQWPQAHMEDIIGKYRELGVNIFAIDVNGSNIPQGTLAWFNAVLEHIHKNQFLIMILGQSRNYSGDAGQTLGAKDVISLPQGYDGYSLNPWGGGGGDTSKRGQGQEETPRYIAERLIDKKGKKRLFVPNLWGRSQVAGVICDEMDLVLHNDDFPNYKTKVVENNNLVDLFNDSDTTEGKFYSLLKLHEAELVEKELTELGEDAREGIVIGTIESKEYAKGKKSLIESERNLYDKAKKNLPKQMKLKI